jgi:hypothetical protein
VNYCKFGGPKLKSEVMQSSVLHHLGVDSILIGKLDITASEACPPNQIKTGSGTEMGFVKFNI